MIFPFIVAVIATFAITAAALIFLIPKLKSFKMGQTILDIGPRWHKSKEGTPTMGGLSFIFAMTVVFAISCFFDFNLKFLLTFAMALLNGCIGFIDDYFKFFKKQNEGLKASQKYLLQLIAAGAYLYAMTAYGFLSTSLYIPYLSITIELGWLYYVFALVLITGMINGANLTDGIDGLACSVNFIIGGFFAVASFCLSAHYEVIFSAMLIGACLGFLVYNFYPAKVFMGDTGSLFMGGIVTGIAFMLDNPLIVIVAAFIYVIETLSVIIQIAYFKITHGKRFFKMAPIHHHFEKSGWNELKVVYTFSAFTLIMCVVAFFGIK